MIEHGIFAPDIVDRYKLGVVDKPLPGDERFTGMMTIPYLSRNGVKALKFRNIGGHPKFAQHKGQGVRLYNTLAYFAATYAIGIAEGEIDAIVATERLGVPTIGIPGAEMWTAHKETWVPVFRNFARVLVFRDGDEAGADLADAVCDSLKWRAKVIDPPQGEDVGSMVAAGRAAELKSKFAEVED